MEKPIKKRGKFCQPCPDKGKTNQNFDILSRFTEKLIQSNEKRGKFCRNFDEIESKSCPATGNS